MRRPTEMSRAILKSERAQEMIDYIAPVYGESYVGLWLLEVNGSVLDEVWNIAIGLRQETNPATATLLLDQWEDHYDIPRNHNLTVQQRRDRILTKLQSRGACNPDRLAAAVSAELGGVEVDVYENIDINTFEVVVREVIYDLLPATALIDKKKPAHLIYNIRVATQMVTDTPIKIAAAMTRTERFQVEVHPTFEEWMATRKAAAQVVS